MLNKVKNWPGFDLHNQHHKGEIFGQNTKRKEGKERNKGCSLTPHHTLDIFIALSSNHSKPLLSGISGDTSTPVPSVYPGGLDLAHQAWTTKERRHDGKDCGWCCCVCVNVLKQACRWIVVSCQLSLEGCIWRKASILQQVEGEKKKADSSSTVNVGLKVFTYFIFFC